MVIDQLQFCIAFASHPVMDNDIWLEKCFNQYVEMEELKWLVLFAVSYTHDTQCYLAANQKQQC